MKQALPIMKHLGSILEFTAARNADLLRAFRIAVANADGHILLPRIFAQVADSPAERFWVSEERAAIVISAMLAGRPLPKMRRNKRDMFNEILRRVIPLRSQSPNRSLFDIVSEVVNQPAPKFYLTPRTVGEIFYRIKSGWYD